MNKISNYLPAMAVAAIVVIIAGILYYKNQKPTNENPYRESEQEQNLTSPSSEINSPQSPGMLKGTLKISDNLKRGNLMLIQPGHVIYLFTSRDYSKFLDKEVKVQIEGTIENFSLVDITAK